MMTKADIPALDVTQIRMEIWKACKAREHDETCGNCPYRHECEGPFPSEACIPADYRLNEDETKFVVN